MKAVGEPDALVGPVRFDEGAAETGLTPRAIALPYGEVLGDPVIAAATLDRVLHHSTPVNIKGESYWLMSRSKAGLPTPSPGIPVKA